MDEYDTPAKGVEPLVPFLRADNVKTFAEPCSGNGHLVRHLSKYGFQCFHQSDIKFGSDGLNLTLAQVADADCIITNPPWTRKLMHPLIWHFLNLKPTWLLFDSDWAHNKMAIPFLPYCSHVVSIGRLKWIEGTKHGAKDNCCWYRFDRYHDTGPRFYGRLIPSQLDMLGGPPSVDRLEPSHGNFVEVVEA